MQARVGDHQFEIREAQTGSERRRGLLGETEAPDWGILLRGAPLIHTFGMKFPIDLVWIRGGRVVSIASSVKPGRMKSGPAGLCLELRAGEAKRVGIQTGDRFEVLPGPGRFTT